MKKTDSQKLETLEKEIGIGKYAPQEPSDDTSLFGSESSTKKAKPSKSKTFMSDDEWYAKKMPLPTFYNTHE